MTGYSTPALRVVTPGLLTTIQDEGRFGCQHLGVPVSGALDIVSLHAANLLVGNAPGMAALEVSHIGPTLVVQADDVRVAIIGAPVSAWVLPEEEAATAQVAPLGQSFRLRRGEVLRVGGLSGGRVVYVAVEGGFDIAPVLGSQSTCIRAGIGGWQGRALVAGDVLPLRRQRASERRECRIGALDLTPPRRIRAVLGPQHSAFADSELAAFFAAEYRVGASTDRMGMRLAGRPLRHRGSFDIASDGIAAGSIQVPGSGEPIILLADRQTTGGYPKIATVISADIPALSRFSVGDNIAFTAVSLEEAQEARRRHVAALASMSSLITPVDDAAGDVTTMLATCNLISGFIDIAA